jgi:hypothetical protein
MKPGYYLSMAGNLLIAYSKNRVEIYSNDDDTWYHTKLIFLEIYLGPL